MGVQSLVPATGHVGCWWLLPFPRALGGRLFVTTTFCGTQTERSSSLPRMVTHPHLLHLARALLLL